MDISKNAYCRLCASLLPKKKLISVQTDGEEPDEIIKKLFRLNAISDWNEQILPKTVCFSCNSSLDSAFQFVISIEKAQGVLNSLLLEERIKKEVEPTFSDDENFFFDTIEAETIKQEPEETKPTKVPAVKVKKRGKRKKIETLESIPLSQLKLTWKDYPWTCSYCDTKFPSYQELTTHSVQYHNCCNAFRCTDCGIRKLRIPNFLTHVKRHRKYLKISCYYCHSKFSTPSQATKHELTHLLTEHVCDGCKTTFLTLEELEEHKKLYYQAWRTRFGLENAELSKISENLTCLICNKTYLHKGRLNTHLLTHTERKREHTCDKCGKCFFSKQNLLAHLMLHDNVRPFPCEICKATFKTPQGLRNHVEIIHINKKPFSCEQCGRQFRRKKHLTSHSIIHTNDMPYACTYCDKAFRFKNLLNQHIRQHTGVKPYSCTLCQHDFTNWPNYNKHMKRRHGVDMSKKKRTPEGVYPINPSTGEIITFNETNEMSEWKKQIVKRKRKCNNRTDLIDQSNETVTFENNVTLGDQIITDVMDLKTENSLIVIEDK